LTTILADTKLGVIVTDSNFAAGDTRGEMRKVWRMRGFGIVGLAGSLDEMAPFLLWMKDGMQPPGPKCKAMSALLLQPNGLLWFEGSPAPIVVQKHYHAIGSGASAALAAYEALGFTDPVRAVKIACNHDNGSRKPVRTYKLTTKRETT
jgi:ATP-dependent protease HslVU (ClpYQ) peptidase subunit